MLENRPAEPTSALEDPRLQFFLEHRDQLREWVAIADEVADAVAEVLRGMGPDVVSRAADLPDVQVSERIAGENQYGTVLHRPAWVTGNPPAPFVGVALAWDGKKVDPAGGWPGTHLPYVGVTTSHFTDEGKALEQTLRKRLQGPSGYLNGSYWVFYRHLQAGPDWWRDVAAWREWVIDQLLLSWNECSPTIDEALQAG